MTSLYRSFGGLTLPTTATDGTPSLSATLDPARDVLLACFRQAVISELGAAWDAAAVGTPLDGKAVVQDMWPGAPSLEVIQQRKSGFPILFLARDGRGTIGDYSMWRKSLTQQWGLHYILSPLNIGDVRKLDGALIAVAKVVIATLSEQGHPDYESGSNILDLCSMSTATVLHVQHGAAQFEGDKDSPVYHAMSMTLETVELERLDEDAYPDFQGASFELGTGNADGVITGLIYARTEVPLQKPIGDSGVLGIGREAP